MVFVVVFVVWWGGSFCFSFFFYIGEIWENIKGHFFLKNMMRANKLAPELLQCYLKGRFIERKTIHVHF